MKKFIIAIISIIIVAIAAITILSTTVHDVSKVTTIGSSMFVGSAEVEHHETVYYIVDGTLMTTDEYQNWKGNHSIFGKR